MPLTVPPLTAIIDIEASQRVRWRLLDVASAVLTGGATFVQLRAKNVSASEFLDLASRTVELAHSAGAQLIVNDRADIARLAAADGVHVGQVDLSPQDVLRVMGEPAMIGLSTHTMSQVEAAVRQPVAYVAIGPVFGTSTKATGYEAIGVGMVRSAAAVATAAGLPLVAIGGITLDRARSILDAGASSVAVIADLLCTGDPEARVRSYLAHLAR